MSNLVSVENVTENQIHSIGAHEKAQTVEASHHRESRTSRGFRKGHSFNKVTLTNHCHLAPFIPSVEHQ